MDEQYIFAKFVICSHYSCYHMWNVSVVALMSRVDEAESAISDFQELTGDIASLASGEAILAMSQKMFIS